METEKCTIALGSKVMRQPCRQEVVARAKEGKSRNKRERRRDKEIEKRDSAAPNVIMQWTGSANGGGAGCFVFLFFSR